MSVGFWTCKSGRLYLSLVFCLAVLANALIRNSLSMAIACMVNSTAIALISNKSSQGFSQVFNEDTTNGTSCHLRKSVKAEYEGPFVWTHADQGFLFSALFIGGIISILPSGWLSDRYNPKLIVTVGLLCSTLGCFLTPITAWYAGFRTLFALRFVMGFFGQAVIMSGISSISVRWIPPAERSTVLALYTAGNQIANIIGMPMNAALCGSKNFLGGWPSIFYVNGIFGIFATIAWIIFVTNQPESNKFVSENEKKYIQKSLANQNLGKRKEMMKHIPWIKILTSPKLLTCFICNFTNALLVTVLMTYLPTYFKEALFLDLKSNGIFSALPYVSQWVSKVLMAVIADYMKKKTKISHTIIAKCFTSIGTIGASIFLMACAYMDCTNSLWAVVFLCMENFMFSGAIPGWVTSLICMAPAYAGIIGAIGRFAGQIGAVIAPFIVSAVVVEGTTLEWRTVFLINAGILSFSGILFNIFGSSELQEWAKQPIADKEKYDNLKEIEILSGTGISDQMEVEKILKKNLSEEK